MRAPLAGGVAQIAEQGIKEGKPALLAILLADLRGMAEVPAGGGTSLGLAHPGRFVLRSEEVEMSGQFFVDARVALKQPAHPGQENSHGGQGSTNHACDSSTRCMTATVCSHWRVSAANCFRPAGVSE